MPSDIKGVRGVPAGHTELITLPGRAAPRTSAATGRAEVRGDRVSLTGAAALIQDIVHSLETVPVVDAGRVADVREAVVNGSYEVDPWQIADKLIQLEAMLPEPVYGNASLA